MCKRFEMNDSLSQEIPWKAWVTKAGATGLIAGAAGYVLFGGSKNTTLAGMTVPGAIPMGLGAAGGAIVGDLAHHYISPLIPHDQKFDQMEHAVVSVGAAGAGTALVSSLIGGPPVIGNSLLLGAGSYIAGDYTYNHFLGPNATGGLY